MIVKKKDGTHRFCIDFRRLNAASEKDAYPLPQVTATLDKLRGAQYLSTLDLKNGYWQVPLTPESRPATAFTVPGRGLMQFRVMPFGLHSAPATFQRLLNDILGSELEPLSSYTWTISWSPAEPSKTICTIYSKYSSASGTPNCASIPISATLVKVSSNTWDTSWTDKASKPILKR